MKLTDLMVGAGSAFRDVANFVRYPFQIVSRNVERVVQNRIEQVEIPLEKRELNSIQRAGANPNYTIGSPVASLETHEQRLNHRSAVSELPPTQTLKAESIEGQAIDGRRGRYQVGQPWNQDKQDQVRQYAGFWLANDTPVLIQEYLLTDFNQREVRQVKEQLEYLDSVVLRSGGVQDFRLIVPWDTFVDLNQKRGYLITKELPDSLTLRQYLFQKRTMPAKQVRRVLSQVLQTLWFLHNHTIRFADGSTQKGLAHGNMTLDSLLLVTDHQLMGITEPQFHIYASDLTLWKVPFQRPDKSAQLAVHAPIQANAITQSAIDRDLLSLGVVGFYLLVGATNDRYPDPGSDPNTHPRWAAVGDEPLKQLIRQLLHFDRSLSFDSAEQARKTLLDLPPESLVLMPVGTPTTSPDQPKVKPLMAVLLVILLTGILISICWWLFQRLRSVIPAILPAEPLTSLKSDVADADFPTGQVKYAAVGTNWCDALGNGRVAFGKTLQDELSDRDPRFRHYRFECMDQAKAIQRLQSSQLGQPDQLDFVLGDWKQLKQLNQLQQYTPTPIAFDGIVVFVAYSDPERGRRANALESVPHALDGKISLDALREIYTGNIDQLRQIYKSDQIKFQPYLPSDDQASIDLFEQIIFQNHNPNTQAQQIQQFQHQLTSQQVVKSLPINKIFGEVLGDFEQRNTIGIGFGRLSKVFGQCSVYPLAIETAGREFPVLIQANDVTVNPAVNLCDVKGSYWANTKMFNDGNYPLLYQLSVIYPQNRQSSKQAAEALIRALKTDEGQCLLSEAGLVPITPVHEREICAGTDLSRSNSNQ
jgi:hypothetical protein